eukprot:1710_1
MSINIQRRLSKKAKYLTKNFIRKIQQSFPQNNSYYNIPEDLIYICACYLYIRDEWDLKHNDIIVYNHNTIYHTSNWCWNTAVGKTICTKDNIYEWKLQITKVTGISRSSWHFLVGVLKNEYSNEYTKGQNVFFTKKQTSKHGKLATSHEIGGYGFVAALAKLTTHGQGGKQYGKKFTDVGQTINVILDLKQNTLSYKIDGIDYGKAFDVHDGCEYRLAVSIANDRHIKICDDV